MRPPSIRELHFRIAPKRAVRHLYHRHFGRWPDLDHPVRFTEHLYAFKLNLVPGMAERADKVEAKKIVAEALGPEWIIPTLWQGRELPPREARDWPVPFVLKASHGTGYNALVRSPEDLDWTRLERLSARWMARRFGWRTLERHYLDIEPRLLVEPLIGSASTPPIDYRVHVFGGRPEFFRVRVTPDQQSSYDLDWNKLPFNFKKVAMPDVPRPASLGRMVEAAAVLGKGFPFMRADFYEIEGQPFFSEMTFFPNAGNFKFNKPEYDEAIGRLWPRP